MYNVTIYCIILFLTKDHFTKLILTISYSITDNDISFSSKKLIGRDGNAVLGKYAIAYDNINSTLLRFIFLFYSFRGYIYYACNFVLTTGRTYHGYVILLKTLTCSPIVPTRHRLHCS